MSLTQRLMRDAVSGTIVSLVAISFYVSCAALLFQGQLVAHLAVGIGMSLAGAGLLALISAWKNSVELSSVGPEPATIPVLAGMTGMIAAQCTAASALPTALTGLAIAAGAIGVSWVLLGQYRLGDLVRYIPYPVIGGFLGAVGWLMLSGGLGVVVGKPFSLAMVADLFSPWPSAQLVAGVAVAAVLWWGTQHVRHVLTMPCLILGSCLLVYGWLWWTGVNLAQAHETGWLMPAFGQSLPALPWDPARLRSVDWAVLGAQTGVIVSAVIVGTLALLLSDGSLELAFDVRADLNRDLTALGWGNLAVAATGGLVGGISISRSVLNRQAGAATRISGVVKGVICLLAMAAGGPVIALIPKAVLGGILMFMGAGMLKGWMVDGRRRLARNDYAVVAFIVFLTVVFGFLPAVVAGAVVCCFDFAISSAKQGAVRRSLTRNDWPGTIERGAAEVAALREVGDKLRIVELHGTLFFGSVLKLVADLETLMQQRHPEQLVVDFRRVADMDSSAAQALTRLLKAASRSGVSVVFCSIAPRLHGTMEANGCLPPGGLVVHRDIAQAVAAWEDRWLQAQGLVPGPGLSDWLVREMGSAELARQLQERLERLDLEPGDALFHQGDAADELFLVEQGRLSVTLLRDGQEFQVRSIQAGATVGEMGVYRAALRSATVRAEVPTRVLRMGRATLAELERDAPHLAIGLHRLFVRLLAARLDHANANATALAA